MGGNALGQDYCFSLLYRVEKVYFSLFIKPELIHET